MFSRFSRGVAMVETAITLSFTLLVLFLAFQLFLAGFFQLQADGATFVAGHAYATGSTQSAINSSVQFKGAFPNVTATLQPSIVNPPNTSVSVNYMQWGTTTQRFGGLSLLRPAQVLSTTSITLTGMLGQPITMTGVDLESNPVVVTGNDDAQGVDYNSSAAYGNVWNPLTQDDQNTPPYYVGLAYMRVCSLDWQKPNGPPGAGWWNSCPSANQELHALGLAVFLNHNNYNTSQNGIGPGGVFYDLLCHQRYFAAISQDMQNDDDRHQYLKDNDIASKMSTIMSWDLSQVYAEPAAQAGQLHPLAPGNGC